MGSEMGDHLKTPRDFGTASPSPQVSAKALETFPRQIISRQVLCRQMRQILLRA
jgi:hypothetical protein